MLLRCSIQSVWYFLVDFFILSFFLPAFSTLYFLENELSAGIFLITNEDANISSGNAKFIPNVFFQKKLLQTDKTENV